MGTNAQEEEKSAMHYPWGWVLVALMLLLVSCSKGLQLTASFCQKLNKAKDGDRYDSIDSYNDLQDDSKTDTKGREKSYAQLVNACYDLATEFYEWGWGQCFHFAD